MAGTLGPSGTVKFEMGGGGFEVGAVVAGRYRLLARLGEGAYGQVWKACHVEVPEHKVALKIVGGQQYAARDAEQELRRIASVAHPNVVQLADHGVIAGEAGAVTHVWFTMPLYEGKSLRQRIAAGALPLREAHDVFVPIARGLAALHAAGLRHQDIKPDNVFLADVNDAVHPLVLDLGVATDKAARLPVAGTLGYAAPEQLRAIVGMLAREAPAVELTEAIDTYSLAVTLHEALIGGGVLAPVYAVCEGLTEGATRADLDRVEAGLLAEHERRWKDPLPRGILPGVRGGARDLLISRFRAWMHGDPARRTSMVGFAAELDALLEPERRAHARRRAVALGAGLLAAGGLAASLAVAYGRRTELALGVCRSTLDGMKGKVSQGTATLDECKAVLAVATNDRDQCREDLKKDDAFRASTAGTKTGCTPAENTSYSRLVVDCRKERDGFRADRDRLGSEAAACAIDRDAARRDRDDLKGKLAEAGKERDDLKGKLAEAGKERDALKAKIVESDREREALEAKLEGAAKQLDTKLAEAGKERDAVEAARRRCDADLAACHAQPKAEAKPGDAPAGKPASAPSPPAAPPSSG